MTKWPETSLLATLVPSSRDALLNLGVNRLYGAGTHLVREGDHTTYVILLLAGCVKITGQLDDGREALLAVRARGDIVGEMAALDGRPRSATVTSCGLTNANVITREDFLRYLRIHPDAGLAVNRMLAYRLRQANRRRLDFTGCEALVRIARVLVELTEMYGRETSTGVRCQIKLAQHELAALSGTALETVEKALRLLRHDGVLTWGYRTFTVMKRTSLYRAARIDAVTPY